MKPSTVHAANPTLEREDMFLMAFNIMLVVIFLSIFYLKNILKFTMT
jgi:F0F1-type ATP synthase membrane subunit b/b'